MLERLGGLDELKQFIATIQHPVVITRGPLIVGVNDAWVAILGYRRDQIEGRPYLDFVPPEERTRLEQRAALHDRTPDKLSFSSMTSLALRADGGSTVLHVQPTVIPSSDGQPFILNFPLPFARARGRHRPRRAARCDVDLRRKGTNGHRSP